MRHKFTKRPNEELKNSKSQPNGGKWPTHKGRGNVIELCSLLRHAVTLVPWPQLALTLWV